MQDRREAGRVRWPLLGEHNVMNALAAIAAAHQLGVEPERAAEALGQFRGVKRRMEVRGVVDGVTVYDDFAHHPTAIETTLAGLRAREPHARIIAVLEPRSNTMKLGVHREQIAPSLGAQRMRAWFLNAPELGWDLPAAVAPLGARAHFAGTVDALGQCPGGDGFAGRSDAGDEQRRLRRSAREAARRVARAARRASPDCNVSAIALFPLNIVLFPGGPLPLRIFETRYFDMVRRCMREGQGFGVVLIREGHEVGPADADIYDVGTMAEITDFHQLSDGLLGLSCVGRQRFRILERSRQAEGSISAKSMAAKPSLASPCRARHARLSKLLATVLPQLGEVYAGIEMRLDDAAWVGHRLAEILPIPLADKQAYLEMDDPVERSDGLADVRAVAASSAPKA